MFKFKIFLDFDKEEKWLEDMASNGYHLNKASFGYHFSEGKPEEITIKIDYRPFKHKEDFLDYRMMFEDSGWKHIAGTKNSGIQYFKKNSKTEDDIFSDQHSKAARYKRYANMSFQLAISYLPLLVVFYLTDIIDFNAFINPKELYYTPGLWDKTGASFWYSFLFETPFALMRGFAWAFIPVTMLLFLFFGIKSNRNYVKKSSNEFS